MPPMKRPSAACRRPAAAAARVKKETKGKAKAKAKAVGPPPGSVSLAGEGAQLARASKHDQE